MQETQASGNSSGPSLESGSPDLPYSKILMGCVLHQDQDLFTHMHLVNLKTIQKLMPQQSSDTVTWASACQLFPGAAGSSMSTELATLRLHGSFDQLDLDTASEGAALQGFFFGKEDKRQGQRA